MKILFKHLRYTVLLIFFLPSCDKDEYTPFSYTENNSIKSVLSSEKIISKFIYNKSGIIEETESASFYRRFNYDDEGRLAKLEIAVAPFLFSSSLPTLLETEFLTANNCTISNYRIYKYSSEGVLSEIENYIKKEGEFEYTSKTTLEYKDGKITKANLHNEENSITQFYTYEYDKRGNVKNEKYYSYIFPESQQPRLISEISYKYDNKNNPFRIFNKLGNPGLYTNTNNIVETYRIHHEETPGIDKYNTENISYKYNRENFPVKEIQGNSEFEYIY